MTWSTTTCKEIQKATWCIKQPANVTFTSITTWREMLFWWAKLSFACVCCFSHPPRLGLRPPCRRFGRLLIEFAWHPGAWTLFTIWLWKKPPVSWLFVRINETFGGFVWFVLLRLSSSKIGSVLCILIAQFSLKRKKRNPLYIKWPCLIASVKNE